MAAKSGSERSGAFVWGMVAGAGALIVAGGLYFSGILGGEQPEKAAQDETAAVTPAPETSKAAEAVKTPDAPKAEIEAAPEPESVPAQDDAAETSDPPTETSSAEVEQESTPVVQAPVAPVLDQIFVEKEGSALLSGSASVGSKVNVLLDEVVIHSFTVDASGQFAEFIVLPFSDAARGLVLETESDGQIARSDDYLIAALPEPAEWAEVVASAEAAQAEEEQAQAQAEQPATEAGQDEPVQTETAPETTGEEVADEAAPEDNNDPGQQVAVLRSGEEGVELVQRPAVQDEAPKQVALDTIGYSDEGDVQLTGRAQDGSVVRLYLNNRLITDLTPDAEGQWRGEIEGIDPGVYTLRLDEVGEDGNVVSRIETPFKREPVEVLQAAEPADDPEADPETPPIRAVTVQQGDTLWAISRERYGDGVLYVKVFEANRGAIRNPDLIYPGQIFTIPE